MERLNNIEFDVIRGKDTTTTRLPKVHGNDTPTMATWGSGDMATMEKVSGADVVATGTTSTIMCLGANLLAAGMMAAGAVAFMGVCVPVVAMNMCLPSTTTKPVPAGTDEHVALRSHAIVVEAEWDDEEGGVEVEEEAVEAPAAVAEAVPAVAMAEGSRRGICKIVVGVAAGVAGLWVMLKHR